MLSRKKRNVFNVKGSLLSTPTLKTTKLTLTPALKNFTRYLCHTTKSKLGDDDHNWSHVFTVTILDSVCTRGTVE